jgi:hypothetical protein
MNVYVLLKGKNKDKKAGKGEYRRQGKMEDRGEGDER